MSWVLLALAVVAMVSLVGARLIYGSDPHADLSSARMTWGAVCFLTFLVTVVLGLLVSVYMAGAESAR